MEKPKVTDTEPILSAYSGPDGDLFVFGIRSEVSKNQRLEPPDCVMVDLVKKQASGPFYLYVLTKHVESLESPPHFDFKEGDMAKKIAVNFMKTERYKKARKELRDAVRGEW